jgi:hypothetical protein
MHHAGPGVTFPANFESAPIELADQQHGQSARLTKAGRAEICQPF